MDDTTFAACISFAFASAVLLCLGTNNIFFGGIVFFVLWFVLLISCRLIEVIKELTEVIKKKT